MEYDGINPDVLTSLYDADAESLTADERRQLTPILNSLQGFGDRYETLAMIGKGAEKEIYRVFDRQLGRRVALAYPVKAETAAEVEQFLREARLMANLAHPNILPIHNMGIDPDGRPFFTMELLPGDSLKDVVCGLHSQQDEYLNRYPLDVLLGIYLKICDAMAYAHSRGVLHLDLKPSNIRVGPFGDVFICDWGLARIIREHDESVDREPGELDGDELNDLTLSGTMKGTPGFMAPEQAAGNLEKTVQTDIYAMGAILYMLLVYEKPVKGESAHEVVENTLKGNIIPPRKRRKQVPISLNAIAMQALSLKAEDRYESVQALQSDIMRYTTGHAALAENAGMVKRIVLLTQRHAMVALVSLLSLTILTAIAVAAVLRVNDERAAAVRAKVVAESNFELYRQELEVSKQLNRDVLKMLEYIAVQPDMRHPFLNIELLDRKLENELTPELRRELMAQKGILHFIVQEFNVAWECFKSSGVGYAKALLPVARKFAALKPNDEELLQDNELALMFAGRPVFKQFSYYTYLHHMRRLENQDLAAYAVLAGTMLEEMNGPRPTEVVSLDIRKGRDGYILDLSGKPYSRYKLLIPGVFYSNVLAPYEFERLDISHTPLTDLVELEDLKVKTLRMVGLDWMKSDRHLMPRLRAMGVERLIVEKGRFSGKIRDALQRHFELVEE